MNFTLTENGFKTGCLRSKDQTLLFYRHYPLQYKKALILLLHGFGEHSGRYSHLIERLRSESYEVFCLDFRGHGHSKGERGDVKDFALYTEDVIVCLDHMQNKLLQGKKLFLLAHSMGALVGLHALAHASVNVAGVVFSSPLFALKIPVSSWKKWAAFLVASIIPKLRFSTGIKGKLLSSDKIFVQAYDNDPLVLKRLSVRAFREIYNAYQDSYELAKAVSPSLLLQVAGSDPIVDSKMAKSWFKVVDKGNSDATLKVYRGFLHEIYNETMRSLPIDDLVQWLDKRI